MKCRFFSFFLVLFGLFFAINASSQQVANTYFLENSPLRHHFNPAFQPVNSFYIGLPAISNIQFGYQADFPTLKDAGFTRGTYFNTETDLTQLLNAFKQNSDFSGFARLNLFDMGFRYNDNYWTFSLTTKIKSDAGIPRGVAGLALEGLSLSDGFSADYSLLDFSLNAYTEASLGYSRLFSEKFSAGLKLKLLYGNARFAATTTNSAISLNGQQMTANAAVSIQNSSPFIFNNLFDISGPSGLFSYLRPQGLGAALDLGFSYQPVSFLNIAMSVNDLGVMRWMNRKAIDYQLNFQFSDADATNWLGSHPGFTAVPSDSLTSLMYNSITSVESDLPYIQEFMMPTVNASAEIGFMKNRLSLGVLSRTTLRNNKILEELTASINVRPLNWFDFSVSYALLNGNMSNIGVGANLHAGFINFFLSADYVPLQYLKIDSKQISTSLPAFPIPVGFNTPGTNISVGINFVFGTRQDADNDGISDRFDRCPYTPSGVRVDRRGCPLDSDNDGVPDYLDTCPNTPEDAIGFVGQDGCMLDLDGDGVPDYLDKCPDSPRGAINHVDDKGCLKDSDADGVFDYKDECSDTPLGIEVDTFGCPIDADGDGVADYLDLCPDTPHAARGFVDQNGCPVDSDDDGVPDYLDLCPDTPLTARGFVDINGCLVDADDDGVPDFLDNCLNTPFAARGSVDSRGCSKDTDGDGVPDYLDQCPSVPGKTENMGCPEVRTEHKSLLLRAIQGVKFDRDSLMLMPSSFEVLDQIASLLKDNPMYQLEIQGHTDNQPRKQSLIRRGVTLRFKAEMPVPQQDAIIKEQISEEYAKQVQQFLYLRGVDVSRMVIKPMSDSKPVAGNNTEAGRLRNCRVELYIFFKEVRMEKK